MTHGGLILNPPEADHWELGGSEEDVLPSGDWTPYKAADEDQSRFGFDTNGCALYGSSKALIMHSNLSGFDDFPKDVAERYLGVECGTTPTGTDPHVVAETIRNICGLIPQALLPWTSDRTSYATYYQPRPMDSSLLAVGRAFLNKFVVNHKWVFAWGSSVSPKDKQVLLKDALKKGAVCVSVDGAYRTKGKYLTKAVGAQDTHWVPLLRFEGNHAVIHDQYPPYEKRLDENYDHNAAKVFFLKRNLVPVTKSFWDLIWDSFSKLWSK